MTNTKPATILVVEDEPRLVRLIRAVLEKADYRVITVHDGEHAIEQVLLEHPDLVLLDLLLPGPLDGYAVAERLRQFSMVPIIMVTARTHEEERLRGFEAGADDYITKPFSTQELLARIRAVLRRRAPEQVSDSVAIGALLLDGATYRVTWQGQLLKVGPTEFKLLHYLMKHSERVHSRSQLLDKVWGDHVFIEERTVDVHVKRLREALGAAAVMLETVRGAGYRITAQPQVSLQQA